MTTVLIERGGGAEVSGAIAPGSAIEHDLGAAALPAVEELDAHEAPSLPQRAGRQPIDEVTDEQRRIHKSHNGRPARLIARRCVRTPVDRSIQENPCPLAAVRRLAQSHIAGSRNKAAVAGAAHGGLAAGIGKHVVADRPLAFGVLRLEENRHAIFIALAGGMDLVIRAIRAPHDGLVRREGAAVHHDRVAQTACPGEAPRELERIDEGTPIVLGHHCAGIEKADPGAQNLLVDGHRPLELGHELARLRVEGRLRCRMLVPSGEVPEEERRGNRQ